MDYQDICPICGKTHKILPTDWGINYYCENVTCCLYEYLFEGKDNITKERWLNVIYNFLLEHPYKRINGTNNYWKFFYEETNEKPTDERKINIYQLMNQYPYQVIDRMDKIIVNLSRCFPLLSDHFSMINIENGQFRLLYCESDDRSEEIESVFSALKSLGWIEISKQRNSIQYDEYRISIDGWRHVSELTKNNSTVKQGFIAMSFAPEAAYIENAFNEAIRLAKYEPQVIKNKEHNNYIVPEIFYEIKRSKFLIIDLTFPNYGAYYEAGYAQALGKEVIACCKKDVFDDTEKKPHFDIAQKSMIIWVDKKELIEKLSKRIIATVN